MTLYLCVFDEKEEVAGLLVGHYSDFGCFRDAVASRLGSDRFPLLLEHSDCDGAWEVGELRPLREELLALSEALAKQPPFEPVDAFEHTAERRVGSRNMLESFHSVDGRQLVGALLDLCDDAIRVGHPILFQ